MGLSGVYGAAVDAESIRTIHRAIDLGISFFDTAAGYGAGHNESLLGRAIRGRRDGLILASKFTHDRGADVPPLRARDAVDASLTRLGVDHIDLYYLHRRDPGIPIEESVGQLGRLVDDGKIGGVGLSEVSAACLRRAHATYPITALQSEYSLWSREVEDDILPTAARLGIGFVAYSPLGRGFLAGAMPVEAADRRNFHPRFQTSAVEANARPRQVIERIAARLAATPAQISLAWTLARAVVPIPGTRSITHLESNWAANMVSLDATDIDALEAAFPRGQTVGDRCPREQMILLPEGQTDA
ncbi:aldo/keto reductase [uncultured Sphingomonas sp.]|uniref:aldo/keto reductase n=1 Tax=uncultured Sphingomonas sp. TaxID=158754 RepID=UPI00261DE9DC|nr:aldo/keto reductase [uncultured Sphingomonas sp.]